MKVSKISAALVALLLAVFGVMTTISLAQAEDPPPAACVPAAASTEQVLVTPASDTTVVDTAAWTETVTDVAAHLQRYSWNGVWESNTEAPPFPDGRWQSNVAGDPHGVGVAGAYFRSNDNSGNGDWFYLDLVPAVTHTVEHAAVTHVVHVDAVYQTVDHPAVVCPEPTPTPTVNQSEVLAAEPNVSSAALASTPTPTPQVAAVPAGALSTGDGSTAALASTGANPLPWSLAALLLIASGSLLLPKVRRVVFRH